MADGPIWRKHARKRVWMLDFPGQTLARRRRDHAECVTKMLRSEQHLSPELKPLDSVSVNTKHFVSHAQMHAPAFTACSARAARNQNCNSVWNGVQQQRGGWASTRADLRQSPLLCASVYRSRFFGTDCSQTLRARRSTALWIHRRGRLATDRTKSPWVWSIWGRCGFTSVSFSRL